MTDTSTLLGDVLDIIAAAEHSFAQNEEHNRWYAERWNAVSETKATIEGLMSQLSEAREALEPLADIAADIASIEEQCGDMPSPDHMLRLVPMRHLRKAHATLQSLNSSPGSGR